MAERKFDPSNCHTINQVTKIGKNQKRALLKKVEINFREIEFILSQKCFFDSKVIKAHSILISAYQEVFSAINSNFVDQSPNDRAEGKQLTLGIL